jgi:hypothetical protein
MAAVTCALAPGPACWRPSMAAQLAGRPDRTGRAPSCPAAPPIKGRRPDSRPRCSTPWTARPPRPGARTRSSPAGGPGMAQDGIPASGEARNAPFGHAAGNRREHAISVPPSSSWAPGHGDLAGLAGAVRAKVLCGGDVGRWHVLPAGDGLGSDRGPQEDAEERIKAVHRAIEIREKRRGVLASCLAWMRLRSSRAGRERRRPPGNSPAAAECYYGHATSPEPKLQAAPRCRTGAPRRLRTAAVPGCRRR